MGKDQNTNVQKDEKERILKILSKHVSHSLEELSVKDLFDGVRDISTIRRKMSKSHFKAIKAVIEAGKEINFWDLKI